MSDVRSVTVRLPVELHRLVKVRCAERGDSLEGVARAAFVAYLERDESEPGSVLERAGVRPAGLGAAQPSVESAAAPTDKPSSAAPNRAFRPDPKRGSK